MTVFRLIGALLILYIAYAIVRGRVIAKSGPWARVVTVQDSPEYFWLIIALYAVLSIALFTVF